VRAAMPT